MITHPAPHPSDEGEIPEIVGRIRERFARGQPLNITAVKRECPELIQPVYRPDAFVGWRKTLERAGITYSDINVELSDTVECLLCGRQFGAIALHLRRLHDYTGEDYLAEFPDAEILSEQTRTKVFGVFRRNHTFRESRLLVPHWEPLWSPEYALDRLLYLHEQGHPIYWQRLYSAEKALGAYLLRIFNGYDHALAAIGLDPAKIRHATPGISWNREKILAAFRERLAADKSLTYSVVEEEFPGLACAASKHFGAYRTAIKALGIDYEGEVKMARWRNTRALRREILAEARRLAAMPEYDWNEIEKFRKKYRTAIQPLFRGWHRLATEAGMPVEWIMHRRFYVLDRGAVLEGLQRRHQAGLSMRSIDLARDNRKLGFSVLKHFGKLSVALREAGIEAPRGRQSRYADAQAVLNAILGRKAGNKPLDSAALLKGLPEFRDRALVVKARQFFGSWRKAIIAADLDPTEEKVSPVERYPTSDAVCSAIRQRKSDGHSLRQAAVRAPRGHGGDLGLLTAAVRQFGSWHAALSAAGLDPHRESAWRRRKYPSPQLVLEAIRSRHEEGRSLNTTVLCRALAAEGGDQPLHYRAKKFFGSWENALAVALRSGSAAATDPR